MSWDLCTLRPFDGETFFKTGGSVISARTAFHAHFMLCQNDAVLDFKKSMLQWVENLWTRGSSI